MYAQARPGFRRPRHCFGDCSERLHGAFYVDEDSIVGEPDGILGQTFGGCTSKLACEVISSVANGIPLPRLYSRDRLGRGGSNGRGTPPGQTSPKAEDDFLSSKPPRR